MQLALTGRAATFPDMEATCGSDGSTGHLAVAVTTAPGLTPNCRRSIGVTLVDSALWIPLFVVSCPEFAKPLSFTVPVDRTQDNY
jgi:hypothetical protein